VIDARGRVRLLRSIERMADRCERLACQIETSTSCD
jgi:phosphate uptake regulator